MQKNNLNYKTANSFSMNAILIIGLAILLAANISAATITVTNTNDSGAGSLRQAISSAASGDTIDFNLAGCPCTIALTSAELLIDRKNLFITGAGVNQLTITDSTIAANQTITGGINNTNILNVSRSTISGNVVGGNGGINNSGTSNLNNSTVSGNQATGGTSFGGINNADNSTTSLSSSTIAFNTNTFRGGGVVNGVNGTVFNVQNTIIALNTAANRGTNGLGIFVSQGFNLIGNIGNNGDITGLTNGANGDIVGTNCSHVNPLLNPLAQQRRTNADSRTAIRKPRN